MLELVRKHLGVIRARPQVHIGEHPIAGAPQDGERPAVARHTWIDSHGDTQALRRGDPGALCPERRRTFVDALERLLDVVKEEDIRGQKRATALLPGGERAAEYDQEHRHRTHP